MWQTHQTAPLPGVKVWSGRLRCETNFECPHLLYFSEQSYMESVVTFLQDVVPQVSVMSILSYYLTHWFFLTFQMWACYVCPKCFNCFVTWRQRSLGCALNLPLGTNRKIHLSKCFQYRMHFMGCMLHHITNLISHDIVFMQFHKVLSFIMFTSCSLRSKNFPINDCSPFLFLSGI